MRDLILSLPLVSTPLTSVMFLLLYIGVGKRKLRLDSTGVLAEGDRVNDEGDKVSLKLH